MMKSIVASAGLVASAYAFTQPTAQTYGSLLTPDLSTPLTTGQDYQITWQPKQPAEGVTVSLVLCNGPSTNCVLQGGAIVEGVPAAAGSYKWSVPCSLPEGVQNTATGYGMLVIVDGTGEFQYSTQFSVNKGESCAAPSSTTTSSMTTSVSTTTSSEVQSSPIHSISGRPSGFTDTTGGWYGWTSTMNTTTISSTASSKLITTSPAAVTSKAVVSSVESAVTSAYVKPTSSAPVVTTATSAKPSQYTGAASQQIVNFGLIGAAGLAVFAL